MVAISQLHWAQGHKNDNWDCHPRLWLPYCINVLKAPSTHGERSATILAVSGGHVQQSCPFREPETRGYGVFGYPLTSVTLYCVGEKNASLLRVQYGIHDYTSVVTLLGHGLRRAFGWPVTWLAVLRFEAVALCSTRAVG